jgi:C-terminal processing protease CtpA/Prc
MGNAAIVADGMVTDESLVATHEIELIDGVAAQVRLGELVYPDGPGGVELDLTFSGSQTGKEEDAAFQAALALVRNFKLAPHNSERTPAQGIPTSDRPYSEMRYPPSGYRLLAAFRIWTVINYFFPYKDLMGEDWDAVLREFIPKMEQAGSALEYHLAVAEMVSHIHDSHGFVSSPILSEHFGALPPVRVRVIEGAPVITAFGTPSSSTCGDPVYSLGCPEEPATMKPPAAGLEVGDVIVRVDGEDAKDRMTRMSKYIAASTPQALLRDAAYFALAGPRDSKTTLTLRGRGGPEKEVELPRNVWNFLFSRLSGSRSGEIYRLLTEEVGYTDLTRLNQSMVDGMFKKLKDTKAIIFDMRGLRGESGVNEFLAERERPINAIFQQPVVMFPDTPYLQQWITQTILQRLPTKELRYRGRTVMLIDERTQSAGEHYGLALEAAKGTKFVGSPSAGANGEVTSFWVPGGIQIHFSGWAVRHADDRQLQRVGLLPDIEVKPTIAGIRSGKDEVLDKALEYLQREIDTAAKK